MNTVVHGNASMCHIRQEAVPFIIFKRKSSHKKDFPHDVIVCIHGKSFIDELLIKEWLRFVWNQQPQSHFQWPNIKALDLFWSRPTTSVKQALYNDNTVLVVIPGGMTSVLQPLDVALNKKFRLNTRTW